MAQAFENIRVLELCHVIAAPYAAYLLALQGADVIKVEPPAEPDCVRGRGVDPALNAVGMGANYLTQNGNKRAIAIDLATQAGRDLLLRLVDTADVLIENYRAGALAALGLSDDVLRTRNPQLITCSLTGFGEGGPRSEVNAYDNVIQAASGLMAGTRGADGSPVKIGASIVDVASGMAAAFAITSALLRRKRDGKGVHIDCAMLDTALSLLSTDVTNTLLAERSGWPHQGHREAGLGCYPTADGLLMLGAFNRRQHERMWRAFGRDDYAAWSSWAAMADHAAEMAAELGRLLLGRGAAEWEAWFHGIGVPAERVRGIADAIAIVDVQERDFLQPMMVGGGSVRVPTAPFRFSEDGPRLTRAAPQTGGDTDAILAGLDRTAAEIAELRATGVVA